MAISGRLKEFLDAAKVKYSALKHPVVYTAQEIAAAQHVPGRQLAKSVLVKTDGGPVLAVLPAIALIDLKKLKAFLRAKTLTIAKEADIKERFPDVEVGAMSPFGNLYNVPIAADRSLEEAEEIVFNAGSHTDTITMRFQDFAALARPTVGAFSHPFGRPKTAKKKSGAAKRTTRARSKSPANRRAKRPLRRR